MDQSLDPSLDPTSASIQSALLWTAGPRRWMVWTPWSLHSDDLREVRCNRGFSNPAIATDVGAIHDLTCRLACQHLPVDPVATASAVHVEGIAGSGCCLVGLEVRPSGWATQSPRTLIPTSLGLVTPSGKKQFKATFSDFSSARRTYDKWFPLLQPSQDRYVPLRSFKWPLQSCSPAMQTAHSYTNLVQARHVAAWSRKPSFQGGHPESDQQPVQGCRVAYVLVTRFDAI